MDTFALNFSMKIKCVSIPRVQKYICDTERLTLNSRHYWKSHPGCSLHLQGQYYIQRFVSVSQALHLSDTGQVHTPKVCITIPTESAHMEVTFYLIYHLFADFCLHILYFSQFSPRPLSLSHPSAAATWSSHFSIPPSTSSRTNTYNHLSLFSRLTRGSSARAFLSQNMWRELIGSSVRLLPPDCFCVAVTCSSSLPPPPPSSLTPPSISFILRLAFSTLSFSFYVFFFVPCLSSLCHDPLKPSATAEKLCWVLWGGIKWAALADVSIREVKRRKLKMKKALPASLNSSISHKC